MKRILTIPLITVFLSGLNLSAQKVLFENKVDPDDFYQTYGPNEKNFNHFYFGAGMQILQGETGAAINYGTTYTKQIGLRYKRKLNNTFAIGYDLSWMKYNFNLKQDAEKLLPNSVINDREMLVLNNFCLELYYRINFGKRGNYMGTFIDMGGYGNWAYRNKHVTVNDFDDDPGLLYGRRIVTNRRLKYTQPFNYGVRGRIGINRFVIFCEYRLSGLFKEEFNLPEFPKLQIGLQIGLHQ